jgi:hypothetical protein
MRMPAGGAGLLVRPLGNGAAMRRARASTGVALEGL